MTARLIAIARVHELRAPLEELETTTISVASGIDGDARGRKPGRQVSVLFREGWSDACHAVGADLPWTTRRANLCVEELDFPRAVGWRMGIGDVVLEVTEETKPC